MSRRKMGPVHGSCTSNPRARLPFPVATNVGRQGVTVRDTRGVKTQILNIELTGEAEMENWKRRSKRNLLSRWAFVGGLMFALCLGLVWAGPGAAADDPVAFVSKFYEGYYLESTTRDANDRLCRFFAPSIELIDEKGTSRTVKLKDGEMKEILRRLQSDPALKALDREFGTKESVQPRVGDEAVKGPLVFRFTSPTWWIVKIDFRKEKPAADPDPKKAKQALKGAG